jgi:hypothetical protein
MGIRRYIRGFRSIVLLVIVWLLVIRPLLDLIGGVGRLVAYLVLASLLMFVVSRSADICRHGLCCKDLKITQNYTACWV